MKQIGNLTVYGKLTQTAAQGTDGGDAVRYDYLTLQVPAAIPDPTGETAGQTILTNGSGGYTLGPAGAIDGIKLGSSSATAVTITNRYAIIPVANDVLGVVKINGGGLSIDSSTGLVSHSNTVTANTTGVGSASQVPVFKYDANGHITDVTPTDIAIAGEKITSGTVASARLPTATTSDKGAVTIVQGTSDTSATVPTVTKMEQYVTTAIGNPMIFKGTVGSSGTVEWSALPAAASGNRGWTYKVITAHATAPVCEEGDTIISDGSAWVVIPSGDEPEGTVTSVSAGTGLTTDQTNAGPITSSGTISLANTAVTAGSYGDDGNTRTLSHGGTFKVPYYTVDAQGRLTASSTKTLTLPGSGNTVAKLVIGATASATADATTTTTNTTTFLNLYENSTVQSHHQISGSGATTVAFDTTNGLVISSTDQSVDSAAHHYTPATVSGNDKTASASGATAAWSIDVVKGITINTDGKGHITGLSVTSGKIPGNPGDTKVQQKGITTNGEYPILLKYDTGTTDVSANYANFAKPSDKVPTINPSTGAITAAGGFIGNASSATDATNWTSNPFAVTDVSITEVA